MKTFILMLVLALPWGLADYLQTLPWYLHLGSVLGWVAAVVYTARWSVNDGR